MKLCDPLPYETTKSYVLRLLKENIVSLELKPGSQISENELAGTLGVSRTPIREAISELEKVQLLEVHPQKKTVVSLIDYKLVEEASFLRSTMEEAVISLVCEERTKKDLIRFEENITLQRLYYENGALEDLAKKDNEFHRYFFEISRKMVIYQLMQNLQTHFDRVRSLSLIMVPHASVIEDHEAIFACIKKQDAEEAKKLIARHLKRYKVDAVSLQKAYPQYFVSCA